MERAVGQTEPGVSGESTEGWGFAAPSDLCLKCPAALQQQVPYMWCSQCNLTQVSHKLTYVRICGQLLVAAICSGDAVLFGKLLCIV